MDAANQGNAQTANFLTSPVQVVPPSNGGYGSYVAPNTPPNNVAYGSSSNTSFVVFGPNTLPGTDNVNLTANIANLSVTIANPDQNGGLMGNGNPLILPNLLLQRLACPELPYNATTNPYITVDYFVFQGQVNDARQYLSQNNANPGANANLTAISSQNSYVHRQPYASYSDGTANSQIVKYTLTNPAPPAGAMLPATPDNSTMNHSFFRHNGQSAAGQAGWNAAGNAPAADTLDYQFEWLVQLDRGLVSPIEAMYVSAYRPWELTQQFIYGGTWWANGATSATAGVSTTAAALYRHRHLAVWDDNTTRLFRALALFETPSRTLGMGMGGRVPGKVNINTIWNNSIFQSIGDANANGANYFTSANTVNTAFASLFVSRTPGGSTFSQNDQPFWGLGLPIDNTNSLQFPTSQYPNGFGVENTILRHTAATVGSTFQGFQGTSVKLTDNTTQTHPYLVNEMLNKVYNNLTTRSNCFAVWMTIGYFEVVNPGPFNDTNRPILGQELGINEGTSVRHKFFAVVDRTKLSTDPTNSRLQGTSPIYFRYEPANAQPLANDQITTSGATTVNVNIPATYGVNGSYLTGTYDGIPWTINVGSTFTITPDTVGSTGVNALYPAGKGVVNGYQQTATVTGISFTQGTPGTSSNTAQITLSLPGNVQAYRGSVMLLNPTSLGIPGNPGPQNGFNYRDPRYSAVVPYAAQIK